MLMLVHSTVPLFVFRTSPESQQLKRGLGHLGLEAQTQHTRWQARGGEIGARERASEL